MYSFPQIKQDLVPADLAWLQIEMKHARQVQSSLLPKQPPSISGLDLWGGSQPATHLCGDFYDFLVGPNDTLTFFVGDVSGHGLAAALLMTMARAIIKAEIISEEFPNPQTVLKNANEKLLADFVEAGMYVSVFIGMFNPTNRELLYANAGHSPVIYRPAGGKAFLLEAEGVALGVLPDCLSTHQHLLLGPEDVLITGTDGLSDACNSCDQRFGNHRLLSSVESLAWQPAESIAENLYRTIRNFSAPEPQSDDQTMVVLRCMNE